MESREEKFERWAKEWDDKLPNLAKALRSKDLQDNLAFIENFNPMNTPISPELQHLIDKEAETYAEDVRRNQYKIANESFKKGATAYAPYKELFEQAKKALEEIIGCGLGRYTSAQDYKNCVDRIAGNLLATWKEEGGKNG